MSRAKFRGLPKVEIQFFLTVNTLNLKEMIKMLDIGRVKSGFMSYYPISPNLIIIFLGN